MPLSMGRHLQHGSDERLFLAAEASLPNPGVLANKSDRLRLLMKCGEEPAWAFWRNDVSSNVPCKGPSPCRFVLPGQTIRHGILPSHFKSYRKCRCSFLHSYNCKKDADFDTDLGGVSFVLPRVYYAACILSFVACLLVALVWKRPAQIDDISREGERTFVKTRDFIWVFQIGCVRNSFTVHFADTKHPLLDGPRAGSYKAIHVHPSTLELLTPQGGKVSERLDTSRGHIYLQFPMEFFLCGFVVPYGVVTDGTRRPGNGFGAKV